MRSGSKARRGANISDIISRRHAAERVRSRTGTLRTMGPASTSVVVL